MSLRLIVEGSMRKVTNFVDLLHKLPQYRFYDRSKCAISSEELRINYVFDEKQMLPPSIVQSSVNTLKMVDQQGQEISILLLNCKMAQMKNGHTIIYGVNYDVFAG